MFSFLTTYHRALTTYPGNKGGPTRLIQSRVMRKTCVSLSLESGRTSFPCGVVERLVLAGASSSINGDILDQMNS